MLNGRTSKLLKFEVGLDNPIGIYQPGDVLQGRVSVKAAEDIPVHGQYISYFPYFSSCLLYFPSYFPFIFLINFLCILKNSLLHKMDFMRHFHKLLICRPMWRGKTDDFQISVIHISVIILFHCEV